MKYFFADRRNGSRCRSAALPNTGAGVAFPKASGELASDAWVAVPQGLGARWGAAGCTVWKRGFPEMTVSHRLRMGTMTGHRWCGTAGGRGLGSSGRQKGSGCSCYSPPAPLKKRGKGSRARPAHGKDGQAHGEVPPPAVVPQGPPAEHAFPPTGGSPPVLVTTSGRFLPSRPESSEAGPASTATAAQAARRRAAMRARTRGHHAARAVLPCPAQGPACLRAQAPPALMSGCG